MQVIQEGRHRWYRSTYQTRSVISHRVWIVYGIGISGQSVEIGRYTSPRAASFARVCHAANYHRALRDYQKGPAT